jgi:hypothetical protein
MRPCSINNGLRVHFQWIEEAVATTFDGSAALHQRYPVQLYSTDFLSRAEVEAVGQNKEEWVAF